MSTSYRLLLRFETEERVNAVRIAHLSRSIRELAERELQDVETMYGFVVDVLEPRREVTGGDD